MHGAFMSTKDHGTVSAALDQNEVTFISSRSHVTYRQLWGWYLRKKFGRSLNISRYLAIASLNLLTHLFYKWRVCPKYNIRWTLASVGKGINLLSRPSVSRKSCRMFSSDSLTLLPNRYNKFTKVIISRGNQKRNTFTKRSRHWRCSS